MNPASDTDRFGDGDVPEADYEPYQDNHFDPHPQADGENNVERKVHDGSR